MTHGRKATVAGIGEEDGLLSELQDEVPLVRPVSLYSVFEKIAVLVMTTQLISAI